MQSRSCRPAKRALDCLVLSKAFSAPRIKALLIVPKESQEESQIIYATDLNKPLIAFSTDSDEAPFCCIR